jgi:hypothetical protein
MRKGMFLELALGIDKSLLCWGFCNKSKILVLRRLGKSSVVFAMLVMQQ